MPPIGNPLPFLFCHTYNIPAFISAYWWAKEFHHFFHDLVEFHQESKLLYVCYAARRSFKKIIIEDVNSRNSCIPSIITDDRSPCRKCASRPSILFKDEKQWPFLLISCLDSEVLRHFYSKKFCHENFQKKLIFSFPCLKDASFKRRFLQLLHHY
jgi:hypothetical protein